MCVIIYIPENKEISKEEFNMAWDVNPHGGGFSIRTENGVYYHRGFMNKDDFYNEIIKYMGEYEMMLHFRISTSKSVNKVQTHPYNINNIEALKGFTKNPVVSMNGIISKQKEYIVNGTPYNDTMSYILDNNVLFKNINQSIIDIVEDDTDCRWCAMTPKGTIISSEFLEKDGIYYSNDNHLRYMEFEYYFEDFFKERCIHDLINDKVYDNIKKDNNLIKEINKFIHNKCDASYCVNCTKCLTSCKTIRDIKICLEENK